MSGKSSKARMRKCCNGKRRFDTIEQAKAAAAALAHDKSRKGDPIVTHLRAYGCACGGFHFGRTRSIDWDRVAEASKPNPMRA